MKKANIWEDVKKSLSDSNLIQSKIFDYYIKPSTAHFSNENNLLINVRDAFAKDVLKKNTPLIREFLAEKTGEDIAIHFLLPDEMKRVLQKDDRTKDLKKELQSDIKAVQTFDNFVKGDSNKEAFIAAYSVASKPGESWNPLFIYGTSGLGKTHLLNAITNYINKNIPNKKILYFEASNLGKTIIKTLQKTPQDLNELREKICENDILLIDDIQMISNWNKTNEFIFDFFNHFTSNNKQIVITSDKYPEDLRGFESRMVSRFSNGLSIGVSEPDFGTAVEIIKQKIANSKIFMDVSREAIEFISFHFRDDIRKIEGAINRILFTSIINKNKKIDLEEIQKIFSFKNFQKQSRVSPNKILDITCKHFGVPTKTVLSKSRTKEIVFVRKILVYLLRSLTNEPYKKIGSFVKRDHSTVVNSFKDINLKRKRDKILDNTLKQIAIKVTKS